MPYRVSHDLLVGSHQLLVGSQFLFGAFSRFFGRFLECFGPIVLISNRKIQKNYGNEPKNHEIMRKIVGNPV